MQLGKLDEVNIRDIWKHEQYDFSAWLAKEDNIKALGDVIGLSLVDLTTEAYVGSYRCDLFAKDETTGIKVIIENQLEITDHDHLGKIITYASGLDAKVIVWIVKEAREEHRSAIEWLNNNTVSEINFFLIEVHAYRIGNSLPAPTFNVVERPNGFTKTARSAGLDGDLNKSQSERLEFWTMFNTVVAEKGKPFSIRKATADHWCDVAIGTSGAHIAINLVNKENNIVVELYINDDKTLFDRLYEKKAEIEDRTGMRFDWDRLDAKKASRIKHTISGLNFDDHSNYQMLMEKVIDDVVSLKQVVCSILPTLQS